MWVLLYFYGKQSEFVTVTNLARKIKERLMCLQIFIIKSLLFGFMNKGIFLCLKEPGKYTDGLIRIVGPLTSTF
jgi:hypothetical protein